MPRVEIECPRCHKKRYLSKRDFGRLKRGGMCYVCTRIEQRGQDNPSWHGGKIKDVHGYIHILMPTHPSANSMGYVRESRLVMEEKLGRLLKGSEQVHHINGVKDDNRLDNLSLMRNNGQHMKLHRKNTPRDWHGRFMRNKG